MDKSFLDAYTEAPEIVQAFLYSDDFYSFLDEYTKRFEMDDETSIEFAYLLQDLAIKRLDLESKTLNEIIRERLNYDAEKASQLEFHIKTKFLPLVEKLWEKPKETPKPSQIKREIPAEIRDIIQKAKEVPPQKVLNLQKVIPPKQEVPQIKQKEEKVIDLSQIKPIKTEVPKSVVDIKQTISWEPPKPKEEIPSQVVVIKKQKEEKEKKEGVIDLSNL